MKKLTIKVATSYVSIIISLFLCTLVILKIYNIKNERLLDNKKSEIIIRALESENQLMLGSPIAPNTLIIFYRYDCKYCRAFFQNTYPQIYREFVKHNKLNILLKPINFSQSPEIADAYELLYCLNRIDLFKELHDVLLDNHKMICSTDLIQFQNDLIMENDEIAQCLNNEEEKPNYLNNNKQFKALKQKSVPVFILSNQIFIGKINPKEIRRILKSK